MKKILKVMLVIVIIAGIVFSIINFTSVETKAGGLRGSLVYMDGDWRCMGDGDECPIGGGIVK